MSRQPSPCRSTRIFIIGQDAGGRWLAVETHHLGGGLFSTLRSAIRFVEFETGHRAGAYEILTAPLTLFS